MSSVIGQMIALAVGVAISPVPIIAVILMLLTPKAGTAGGGFLLGWLAGITTGMLVFAGVSAGTGVEAPGESSVGAAIIHLLLGLLLLVLAGRSWRSRPRAGAKPQLPRWLGAIDKVSPVEAVGLGFLLAAVNPKNLALLASAGVDLGRADLSTAAAVAAGAVFVLLAASSVLLPVVIYAVAGQRARAQLDDLRRWLVANNATVMTVLLAVLGVVVVGNGIAAL